MGARAFDGVTYTTRTVTPSSDTDDMIRRQLATALRVGILHYLSRDTLPSGLAVNVRTGTEADRPAVAGDRWKNWVFSLRGSASFDGEETSRERELGGDFSADRITPDWKVTFGVEIEHSVEEFDLDEEEPVHAERRERDFSGWSSMAWVSTGRSAPPATSSRRPSTTSSCRSPPRRRSSSTCSRIRPTPGVSCA